MNRIALCCLLSFTFLTMQAMAAINIGNFVWEDLNRNGIQDSGEPGIAGVTVELWNAAKTQLIHSAITNASGIYALIAPGAGDYRVRVIPLFPGDQFTLKDQGTSNTVDSDINPSGPDLGFTDTFTLAANVISTTAMDAGVISDPIRDHNIGDYVFRATATGTQAGTSPLSGVTVNLLNSSGTVVQTTSSNSNGFYSFKALPGTYRLQFIVLNGMIPTPQANAGSDDTVDSDIDSSGLTASFTISEGQVRRDLDAGFVTLINVGNFVWSDLDGDGVQDAGEPGVANVLVELWNDTKTKRHASTVTNASGNYTLRAPGPGTYRVWVLRPSPDDTFSPKDASGSDLTDSDINADATNFGFTDIFTLSANLISTTTIDAGLRLPAGLRDLTPLRMTSIQRRSGTSWDLTFRAPVNVNVVIESSADFESWKEAISPFNTTSTSTTRTVSSPSAATSLFWRVRRTR